MDQLFPPCTLGKTVGFANAQNYCPTNPEFLRDGLLQVTFCITLDTVMCSGTQPMKARRNPKLMFALHLDVLCPHILLNT